jgi:signal transduction histidine kinase
MPASKINDFQRYENGKQTITLIINIFVLIGFATEILNFYKIYVPLQLYLQIISVGIFLSALVLLLINKKRFYSYCYLTVTYFLIFNIILYDVFFPEFITKLHFLRSEFFSRNLFVFLPFIAIVGFISGKRHIIIQGFILIIYITFQMVVNYDSFLKASIVTYFLSVVGFSCVSYFLVNATQNFIKDLNKANTKLKETQQYLIQSEKMASLGTLTAGIAHEINNPLNFINGGVEIISDVKDEMKHNMSAELQERFNLAEKMIHTGFDRSQRIVQALMNFSDRGESNLIYSNINEIIDNTLLFLKSKIPQEVEIIKSFEFNGTVPVYPSKIHQVILNIIDNAVYAVKQGPQTSKRIEISTWADYNHVVIKISNNGPNIPDEEINMIFDPFFTTKDPGQGTGLGLSISYALIAEHKGNIFARNTKEGVSFIIEIPI